MNKLFVVSFLALTSAGFAPALSQELPDTSKKAAAEPTPAATEKPAAKPTLTVERMVFCTGVAEREPVGEAIEFSTGIGTLYFWSNVLNAGEETSVSHVWYLRGEEKARVNLPAKYPRNRLWSSKTVPAEWAGEWKVEIVSVDGSVLGAASCAVK